MMAANYRHIGCLENRLGRHYSRFSASGPAAPLAAQSLARRKSPNHGSNRRSQANLVEARVPLRAPVDRAPVGCRMLSEPAARTFRSLRGVAAKQPVARNRVRESVE